MIVLAMHGVPPNDFPKSDLREFFSLQVMLEHGHEPELPDAAARRHAAGARATLERRQSQLDAKIRAWPRTAENDPYHAASQLLASHLQQATGYEVVLGFNEFCAPSLDEALRQAASHGASKVIVVTPMMTQGGGHSEGDIPLAIARAKERYPSTEFVYAWPFDVQKVAEFLAAQIGLFA